MKAILIVDDSPMTRNFHAYILRSNGFRVVAATDGVEAMEQLCREPFDMVITDINMPRMDGYTLARQIREDPRYREMPIVMVSSEGEAEDMQRGFEAGANAYLVKPTNPPKLLANVRLLLKCT